MEKIKVAFFDTKPYDIRAFDIAKGVEKLDISYIESRLKPRTVKLADGFNAVCAFVNDVIDAEVIDSLAEQGVKLIALRCAGYNNVDFKAAYQKIHVVRVPAYSPYAVAEHTVALLLTLNRKIHKAYYRVRESNFSINGLLGFDLHGKTAGVIGTGQIGRILIGILRGFGMEVLAFDKYPNETAASELGFKYASLDELYENSDVISLNCPLTPETYHLINDESIAKMKEGVFILNTGRGKLIDTKALITGLKHRKIGGAGLDVYEEEEHYFFEDFSGDVITDDTLARLLTFNNVLITSHQAFFTKEALSNISNTTVDNILSFFSEGVCKNEVCYECTSKKEGKCERDSNGKCF